MEREAVIMANFEVYVSEITEEGKFYACNISDGPALETLMDDSGQSLPQIHLPMAPTLQRREIFVPPSLLMISGIAQRLKG